MSKRKHRDGEDTTSLKNKSICLRGELTASDIRGLRFATESWAGMKPTNEDRHVSSVEHFPGPVFGIFDGHGGTFTSDYLARQLVKNVASTNRQTIGDKALDSLRSSQELSQQENGRKRAILEQLAPLSQQLEEVNAIATESSAETDAVDELQALRNQLTAAIAEMQQEVKQIEDDEAERHNKRQQWHRDQLAHFVRAFKDGFERVDAQILQKNPSRDGSTALLVWFVAGNGTARDEKDESSRDLSFFTVNVGDCRAVMCRGGQGVALTNDHKPDRPDEKHRIEEAGGFVGKIAGIPRVYSAAGAGLAVEKKEISTYLAVSRAFGDRPLKTPTPLVSCEPEVKHFHVKDDDLFLVLACDGIWDVLSVQEVVNIALPFFHDAKAAADAIVTAAYKKGSVDNLTVTVIQFGWKEKQAADTLRESKAPLSETDGNPDADGEAEEEIDMFNL